MSSLAMTEIHIPDNYEETIDNLKFFARFCGMPCYDRWNTPVHLHLDETTMDRVLKETLVRFLNLPLAKDPTGTSDKEVRWIDMTINNLEFVGCDDDFVECAEDLDELYSPIADRTLRLKITGSHSLLSGILNADIERFMAERLHIEDTESFEEDYQYEVFGNMIARSVHLRELYLSLPLDDGAHQVFGGLANAFNLQELSLHDGYMPQTREGELVIGRDGPLMRLLQHRQNQLKKLSLVNFGMKDPHLIAISELLPKSQIEFFDFSRNLIQSEGILEFAAQLPKIHSLKHVRCGSNPFWEDTVTECGTIGSALLHGIMESTALESVDDDTPLAPLLWHYLVLNRAGRRRLTSSQPFPHGIWPLVLERAGNVGTYCSGETCDSSRSTLRQTARYSAVYFILQHCTKVLSFR